jgi:O-Antigen ligase
LSHLLAALGLLVAAGSSAAAILLPPERPRSAAMLLAIALFPALIIGDQWHSHQIVALRDHPGRLIGLGLLALGLSALLAGLFRRWPVLMPLAVVAALPFRIPLHAGGETANLLVPLYIVIGGGVLATAARDWPLRRGERPAGGGAAATPGPAGHAPSPAPAAGPASRAVVWLPKVLAAVVVLYAIQVVYSEDFSKGLQNLCFFFVPFSLVYLLMRDVQWDRGVLKLVLWVIAMEASAFVLVGSVEYLTKSLFWNNQVIRSNEFHTYFRVNSVFWDPNIYGRYLALVAVVAMSALLWARERRTFALLTALVAILWIGLAPTFSQSSFVALLAGLAVLAALRWSVRWTLAAVAVLAVLGVLVVILAGGSEKLSPSRINIDTSGRANLISGGVHLFIKRPVYGYGSGSFPKAYREHVERRRVPVSISHTEPVTIAAEQGLIGLAMYVALLGTALATMGAGLFRWRSSPANGVVAGEPRGAEPRPAADTAGPGRREAFIGRVAVLATFVALLVHTMAYAGFYEDPITWVLLALGAALATGPVRQPT